MSIQYTIEVYEHGILVEGPLPIADLEFICNFGTVRGLDWADTDLSGKLHKSRPVSLAACKQGDEGRKAFWNELGLEFEPSKEVENGEG